MKRIENIEEMQRIMEEISATLQKLASASADLQRQLPEYRKLYRYYGSEQWFKDVRDYDSGKIPQETRAGALSEDAIYDIIGDMQQFSLDQLALIHKLLKITG